MASICHNKKAQVKIESDSTKGQAHAVEGDERNDDYSLYQVSGHSLSKPLLVSVKVNGVSIEMEIDTGASVSLWGRTCTD